MAAAGKMRIILVGQSAFAEKCLEEILGKAEVEVVAVYCNPDTPERPEPVRLLAEKHNLPVHQHKSLKATTAATEEWKNYKADLAILAFVTQFVPDSMISLPRLGTLCFHPSLLPLHRGGSALQWQIIQGKTRGGLSWFWTEPATGSKVDTGPICVQREVEIGPNDTSASLYFKKIFPLGVSTCLECIDLCLKGDPPRAVQDESLATWEPLCNDKVAGVDWNKPASEVYNHIRGCDPQPGAFTMFSGQKVRLFTASLVASGADGKAPGTIVRVSPEGITVACGDGSAVLIGKAKGPGAKVSAAEVAEAMSITQGATFTAA